MEQTRSALSLDQWLLSLCDLTQAEIYLEINMYRDAIQFAEASYKGFETIGKPFEMAKAIGVMAVAHSQLREFKEAGRLFQQARTMFKDQGNEVRAAGMDLYRGVMWLQMGLNADARAVAQTAYDAFIKESVKPKAAFARIVAARASLRLAELEEACTDATLAKTLNDESPLPSVSHQLHALLGEIHQAQNNLPSARDEFRRAITELEDVRAHIAADELRLNYLKDKVPVYEMLLHTDLRLGDAAHMEEAFETAERAKSRTLVDLLAGSVDPLKQASASSLDDIRQTIAPDAALLEYVIIGDSVIAFCVARDRFEVVQNLCSKTQLKKTFGFLQFHLSRFAAGDQAAKARPATALANIQAHLKSLYEMLVRPVERLLSEKKSLVVVPSDFLHYVSSRACSRAAAAPIGSIGSIPLRTALIVIDMQTAFCAPGAPAEVPAARDIVPAINDLAGELRKLGGAVVWVVHANTHKDGRSDWELFFNNVVGDDLRLRTMDALAPGRQTIWSELDLAESDHTVVKNRYSALIPGSSQLERLLRSLDIDTVLIAGTKTNVCCESTARDAMMLDFKVVMLSDCCAALSDDEHRATLETIFQQFGDVATGAETLSKLRMPSNA